MLKARQSANSLIEIFDPRFASMYVSTRLARHFERPPRRGASGAARSSMMGSFDSPPRRFDASFRQRHAAARSVSKKLIAHRTRWPTCAAVCVLSARDVICTNAPRSYPDSSNCPCPQKLGSNYRVQYIARWYRSQSWQQAPHQYQGLVAPCARSRCRRSSTDRNSPRRWPASCRYLQTARDACLRIGIRSSRTLSCSGFVCALPRFPGAQCKSIAAAFAGCRPLAP